MRQIKLNLDEQVDAKLISELEKLANGGPINKALYLFIYDLWHFRAYFDHIPTKNDTISVEDHTKYDESGPGSLDESLADIEAAW